MHGKVRTYNCGCRCQECRAAAAAHRRYYRSLNRPPSRYIPTSGPGDGEDLGWRDKALCATTPTSVFFPRSNRYEAAKAVCADCPVRIACLSFALRTDQPDGVWGGLTFDERQRVIRKRRRVAS